MKVLRFHTGLVNEICGSQKSYYGYLEVIAWLEQFAGVAIIVDVCRLVSC